MPGARSQGPGARRQEPGARAGNGQLSLPITNTLPPGARRLTTFRGRPAPHSRAARSAPGAVAAVARQLVDALVAGSPAIALPSAQALHALQRQPSLDQRPSPHALPEGAPLPPVRMWLLHGTANNSAEANDPMRAEEGGRAEEDRRAQLGEGDVEAPRLLGPRRLHRLTGGALEDYYNFE